MVISDPEQGDECVLVNFTSWRDDKDAACIVEAEAAPEPAEVVEATVEAEAEAEAPSASGEEETPAAEAALEEAGEAAEEPSVETPEE
jgi:hypothetical protein